MAQWIARASTWIARMEIVDLASPSDEQRAELEGDERDRSVRLEVPVKGRHVALRDGDQLVASAGLTTTEVEVAGQRFAVVGVGGVIVNAEHRGGGLARRY